MRWSKSVRRLLGTDLTSPADLHAEKPNSSHDTLFQLAAWGIPAVLTVIVLVARLVDADELFGKSFVVSVVRGRVIFVLSEKVVCVSVLF